MRNCKGCGKTLSKNNESTCSKRCSAVVSNRRDRKHHRITNGYREIYSPESGRKNNYIREHLKVMSDAIGRAVKYPENVHHIDGNKLNNSLQNLYLCDNVSEHTKIHHSMERLVQELYKKGIVTFKDGKYEAVARLWIELNKKKDSI